MNLKEQLNQYFNDNQDIAAEFFYGEGEYIAKDWQEDVRNVASFGGEGQGDGCWEVYLFKRSNEEVYIKFDGWYASHHGSEYEDFFFVHPAEVTRTEYIRSNP